MMDLATFATAFAILTGGASPAIHPHSIKDGSDAIITAWKNFKIRFPESGADHQNWSKDFDARRYAGMWEVKERNGTRTIYIDPNDGHIVSWQNVVPDAPDSYPRTGHSVIMHRNPKP